MDLGAVGCSRAVTVLPAAGGDAGAEGAFRVGSMFSDACTNFGGAAIGIRVAAGCADSITRAGGADFQLAAVAIRSAFVVLGLSVGPTFPSTWGHSTCSLRRCTYAPASHHASPVGSPATECSALRSQWCGPPSSRVAGSSEGAPTMLQAIGRVEHGRRSAQVWSLKGSGTKPSPHVWRWGAFRQRTITAGGRSKRRIRCCLESGSYERLPRSPLAPS